MSITALLWGVAYASMLAAAAWFDVATQRIPNQVVLYGTAMALLLAAAAGAAAFGNAVFGLLVGFAVLLPMYIAGAMGAGDVKLLAGVGAFVGFPHVLGVALASFVIAGAMALLWAVRHRRLATVLGNIQAGVTSSAIRLASGKRPTRDDFALSPVRLPYALAIGGASLVQVLLDMQGG